MARREFLRAVAAGLMVSATNAFSAIGDGTLSHNTASGGYDKAPPSNSNRVPSGPIFRPEDFGHAGSGVDDDSTYIQQAFDAAQANNGGTVLFTSGKTYLINNFAITMQPIRTNDWLGGANPTVKRSGTIIISGYGARILYPRGSTGRFGFLFTGFRSDSTTHAYGNVVLEGLTFDDNGRQPGGEVGSIFWARDCCNVSNMTFKDLTLYGSPGTSVPTGTRALAGIFIIPRAVSRTQARWNYVSNITIDGCNIIAQAKPIGIYEPRNAGTGFGIDPILFDNIVVKNTTVDLQGQRGTGIHVGSYGVIGNLSIENCTCRNSADNLIEFSQAESVIIKGCTFANAPTAVTYSSFNNRRNATLTPSVIIDDCRYTGGNACYWQPGDPRGKTRSVRLLDCYNPRSNSNTWGDIVVINCSTYQVGYEARSASTLNLRVPLTSVRIEGCSFTDGTSLAGHVISVQHRGSDRIPVHLKHCSWNMSGSGSSVDLCAIGGNVDLDLDFLLCRTTVSGNFVNLGLGSTNDFTGAIGHLKADNRVTSVTPVRLTSGTAQSVSVHDCDFSALPIDQATIIGSGFIQTNITAPAGVE